MTQTDKRQTRRGGFYWQKDVPYLSVTEILKTIDKPALRYWFGQQVYYAMLKDPTLNEKDALSAPYKTSGSAKQRGSTIHSLVEAYKNTGARIEFVPEDLQGYATAFYDFMENVKPELLEQEKTVISEEHKVAGTLDAYMKIGDQYLVVDVKTGKGIYPESELQLSAYAHMLRETDTRVDGIAVLLLETGENDKPTGKYVFKMGTERFDIFLALHKVYCWNNESKLLKVGYLK